MKKFVYLFFVLFTIRSAALIIGSNTAVTREARGIFPSADTNNTMNGFASFVPGFTLQTNTTTCTYDNFFPITGTMNIRNGKIVLRQDVTINNAATMVRGGRVEGNNYTIEFEQRNQSFALPGAALPGMCVGDLNYITQGTMNAIARTLDWDLTGSYLTVGSATAGGGNPEVRLFYFDGSTLTATASAEVSQNVNDMHWHPSQPYVAVAANSRTGNDIIIYYWNASNGTFSETGGANPGVNVLSCRWHPSGNYLAVVTASTTNEITLYSFATGTLAVVQNINLTPNRTFGTDVVKWAPGGQYVAIGCRSSTGPELLVYQFSGTLTLTASAEVGANITTLDWSPSGTYIAVGLDSTTNTLRLWSHRKWNGTLVEETTGRYATAVQINGLSWCRKGKGLLATNVNAAATQHRLYTFDEPTKSYSLFDYYVNSANGWSARYAKNNYTHVAISDAANTAKVFSLDGLGGSGVDTNPFVFNKTNLIFNDQTDLRAKCYFEGPCKINARGNELSFKSQGAIIVRPGGSLIIQDALISNLSASRLSCMTDNGSITFINCGIALSNEFTFSRGALLFDSDVIVTGTNKFIYSASRTSTIASYGRLYFDIGTTFSYAPFVAKNNLLYFENSVAQLYMDGATLVSTRTGIRLSNGTVIFDNKVTISSQGRNSGEAIVFDNTMNIYLLGAAQFDLFGQIKLL